MIIWRATAIGTFFSSLWIDFMLVIATLHFLSQLLRLISLKILLVHLLRNSLLVHKTVLLHLNTFLFFFFLSVILLNLEYRRRLYLSKELLESYVIIIILVIAVKDKACLEFI